MTTTSSIVPSQAHEIYKLLCAEGPLPAAQIGAHLGVLPNAVYRSCKQLEKIGVVHKSDSYPAVFETVALNSALGWFLIEAQRDFRQTFGKSGGNTQRSSTAPTISFIKDRASLLAKTDHDVAQANREVKFIVSGLEVPDTTVMAYRRAAARGVNIRALVQKRQTSGDKLEKWQDLGVEVKQINTIDLRLFVIDSRIAYVTSYDESKKEHAFGVRFNYAPFAVLLGDMFEQKWLSAETI